MKGKMLDTYERWQKSGHLNLKLKSITEMTAKRATQRQVAEYLGITEKTVIRLRKKTSQIWSSISIWGWAIKKEFRRCNAWKGADEDGIKG